MGHKRSTWTRISIGAAVALSITASVHAASVDTIFAAENSLYGRGYDIGQADGWLDDTLRAAIKRFQSRTKGLKSTSNLDPDTLKALGIHYESGTVSGNELPTRRAAIAALGLNSGPGQPTDRSPRAHVASAPESKATAEPSPRPQQKPESAPAITMANAEPDPEPRKPVQAAPRPEPPEAAAKPDQPVITRPTKSPTVEPQPAPVIAKTPLTTPAPAENPEARPKPTRKAESNETAQTSSAELAQVTPKAPDVTAGQGDTLTTASVAAPASTEPSTTPATATKPDVSITEDRAENTQKAQGSSGGFFSWLFDMLFGWMV